MSQRTLANPTIEVNDVPIAIVPNSFSFKTGKGDKAVSTQSAGGDAIEVVITENAETKKSMVKFKLKNTASNLQAVKDWSDLFANTITVSEQEITESFRDMVITTEPERMIGADGELEIEWEGAPSL